MNPKISDILAPSKLYSWKTQISKITKKKLGFHKNSLQYYFLFFIFFCRKVKILLKRQKKVTEGEAY